MPSHWTYEKKPPVGDLYQGDIILRSEPLLDVLVADQRDCRDERNLAFIILTQTCDLVIRNHKCKAKYINLGIIRSLESIMPEILSEKYGTSISGVYYKDGRSDVKELIERIINQNEQSLGLFYLEPDGDLKLAVASAALLRAGVAIESGYYQTMLDARIGRLESPFRNKLGWLTGNLYSRVDTPDWPEMLGKKASDKKVDQIFKDIDEAAQNIWVERQLFDRTLSKDNNRETLSKENIIEAMNKNAPPPRRDEALGRIKELASQLLIEIVSKDLTSAEDELRENRAYSQLIVEMMISSIRSIFDNQNLFQLTEKMSQDGRLREFAAESLNRFSNDYMKAKRPKNHKDYIDMYMKYPLFDGAMLELVRENAVASGFLINQVDTILSRLRDLKPNEALRDCLLLVVRSAAARNLPNRLASRLNNDAIFAGAFASP